MNRHNQYLIGLVTPIWCGMVLVQLIFQIIWDILFKNEFYNEFLATLLVGILFYAAFLCLVERNTASLLVSGLFYIVAGILSYFIKGFEFVFLGFTFTINQLFYIWIIVGVGFIVQSQSIKKKRINKKNV